MKHIVLIGMMGCGKSTCGALLSQQLGIGLMDTDTYIETREGRSITEIFAQEGEPYFRMLEKAVGQEVGQMSPMVIACGGGFPLQTEAITPLKGVSHVVFLYRDPVEIYQNVAMSGRPLGQETQEAFLSRYQQREPIYRKWADQVVNVGVNPQETVDRILEVLP